MTDSEMTPVDGSCDDRFARVRDAFAEVFSGGNEVGAALAVYVGGAPVIDVWGGFADGARTRPWQMDTIVNVYSIGKALTALCVLRTAEAGLVELDQPVARYWPEFAQAGKGSMPVRMLLTHQAGLPAVARPLPARTGLDWDAMCAALAEQAPWWEPGSDHGYHTNTQGYLAGEVVRRVTGKSIGAYFREEIAEPAGVDFHFGFGPALDARCAEVLPSKPLPDAPLPIPPRPLNELEGDELMKAAAGRNPPELSGQGIVNSREWRAAEVPSTNGHGNARAVARLYSALATDGTVDGVPVLGTAMRDAAVCEQVYGVDRILGRPTRFGIGFQLTQVERRLGPGARAFGHFGAGGSLGFADPDAGLAFGYAMNQGRAGWQHAHIRKLIDVLYECVE
ncbi:MAG: serine hydrolase domain-containing protein [Dehalococcoidia bacterium]